MARNLDKGVKRGSNRNNDEHSQRDRGGKLTVYCVYSYHVFG